MRKSQNDWGFGPFNADFPFNFGGWGRPGGRGRRRRQMFESGEVKFIILRLLKDKPMHGYEVMKALEEKMAGCYSPSPGTVYPTLQMLEDEGFVRVEEVDGKKVYHVTPEGEAYLVENRDLIDEIVERVKETVRDVAGGAMGDLHRTFGRLAKTTFGTAWRRGPDDPALAKVAEILKQAAKDVEEAWGVGREA
ncbi:MAG TPA: PadR family transcriptional regulator [Gemmatimonadales bacterium]|jgi:DNA-binding PadR family transcriptional regulator|nr:PadR family transcriptional regulator [Gemmatimonadales bacterium]